MSCRKKQKTTNDKQQYTLHLSTSLPPQLSNNTLVEYTEPSVEIFMHCIIYLIYTKIRYYDIKDKAVIHIILLYIANNPVFIPSSITFPVFATKCIELYKLAIQEKNHPIDHNTLFDNYINSITIFRNYAKLLKINFIKIFRN